MYVCKYVCKFPVRDPISVVRDDYSKKREKNLDVNCPVLAYSKKSNGNY